MNILDQYSIEQMENLELLAKQVVEGFIIGLHKSPFHGFSVEFAEHRIYNPGDSMKNIDWKVYARTDKLFIKRFEEETNLRCQIVIDTSSSMYFPLDTNANKVNFSILAGASLMYLLKKQRDAFGLSTFNEELEHHFGAKSSTKHQKILLAALERKLSNPTKNVKTNAARSLHLIAESIHKRSLVVLFSDMFDGGDKDELFSALQHLKYSKHEVILFHVVDKSKEIDFEFENRPHHFIDIETGEEVKLQPNQVKEHFKTLSTEFMQELKLKCGQYKIDFVEADINKGFKQILMPYLIKRSKMK